MSDDREKGPQILDAHQELVRHIEQGAGRMWALSVVTIVVAAFLALSYTAQLALPLTGTTGQTVNLVDPFLIGTELLVLALTLVWLYVGVRDWRFSSKMKAEIRAARAKEQELKERLPAASE